MYWEAHFFHSGPLRFALMHVTADPAGLMNGSADCRVLASARLILRGGLVYAASMAAPASALRAVCDVVSRVLPGNGYDESRFRACDRELASALRSAGHTHVRVELKRNAPMFPRPAVTAGSLARLAAAVTNRQRSTDNDTLLNKEDELVRSRYRLDGPEVARYGMMLDAHALAFQADTDSVCGMPAGRLSVYNTIAGASSAGRYRAQALHALPWLLPVLATPQKDSMPAEAACILTAIDGASSLYAAAATAFGVPREVVRWLGRRSLPASWQLDIPRLRRLLMVLSWLPPEWRPQTPSGFDTLIETCNAFAAILRFDAECSGQTLAARLERHGPCMRRWLAETLRPGSATTTARRDPRQAAREMSDAADFLRVLAESLQDRRRIASGQTIDAVLRWCAGISLQRLIDMSREWHAFTCAAPAVAPAGKGGLCWPAILPGPWQHGEVTIVELTSSIQLHAEGQDMLHCVASFDRVCHRGHSAVMALYGTSRSVRSTAELRFCDVAGLQVKVEQHRSIQNGPPDPACEKALAALVHTLNDVDALPLLRARRDFQRRQHALAQGQAARSQLQHELHAGQARTLAWTLAGRVHSTVSLDPEAGES